MEYFGGTIKLCLLKMLYFIDCINLWDAHVTKKGPITISLEKRHGKNLRPTIYETKDLSTLLGSTKVGLNYTMVLRVSSTCDKDVVVGFTGHGMGWFKSTIPRYSKNVTITTTKTWRQNSYISMKTMKFMILQALTCQHGTITIHEILFMKVSENCLNDNGKYFLSTTA